MEIKIATNWNTLFNQLFKFPFYTSILNSVEKQYDEKIIFPEKNKIFECFNYFDYELTKVVILGQDPYYTPGYANGLAFSVKNNTLPKTLKNILIELNNDLKIKRTSGDLSDWARQGVLLLNSILTVESNKPLSHKALGWEYITDEIIKFLNKKCKNLVYILWGNKSISKQKFINEKNNLVIKSSHPSPLSANRNFFGSKPFSKANNYLKKYLKKEINW